MRPLQPRSWTGLDGVRAPKQWRANGLAQGAGLREPSVGMDATQTIRHRLRYRPGPRLRQRSGLASAGTRTQFTRRRYPGEWVASEGANSAHRSAWMGAE